MNRKYKIEDKIEWVEYCYIWPVIPSLTYFSLKTKTKKSLIKWTPPCANVALQIVSNLAFCGGRRNHDESELNCCKWDLFLMCVSHKKWYNGYTKLFKENRKQIRSKVRVILHREKRHTNNCCYRRTCFAFLWRSSSFFFCLCRLFIEFFFDLLFSWWILSSMWMFLLFA